LLIVHLRLLNTVHINHLTRADKTQKFIFFIMKFINLQSNHLSQKAIMGLVTLVLCLAPAAVYAEIIESTTDSQAPEDQQNIKYVGDNLVIMIRTGQSNKHKIVRAITSGTQLQVLETGEEYSRVRTSNDIEGWVLNQYLMDEPVAKHKLTLARKQIAMMETQNAQVKQELQMAKEERNALKKNLQLIEKEKDQQTDEANHLRSLAAQPLKLSDENQQLSRSKVSLENQVNTLQKEITALRDETKKQWFLTGAGVVLAGILIGLTLSRMRRVRKSDWGSL